MKHLKIIITLTIVVLISVVLIFFVEEVTSEVIDKENFRLANLAKLEVLPGLTVDDDLDYDSTYDFENSAISGIIYNAGIGYIYTVEFQGYSSIVEYMIGINMDGVISGFKVLTQGESPGYGDAITEEDYRIQFEGLAFEAAIAGEIDDVAGLSGAPITMGAFRASLKEAIEYHQSTFGGVVLETPEEKLERWRDEITVEDAIFTDVSENYVMDETVVKMEVANDGSNDVAVVYTVQFSGFVTSGYVEYLISFDLSTNDIIGLRVLHNDESTGIGTIISDESFTPQFDNMLQDDALSGDIDEVAGGSAPITYNGFVESLETVVLFHQEIYQNARPEDVEVGNDELLIAFSEGITFTSVYQLNTYNEYIGNVYEVYDGSSVLIGYVYHVQFFGFKLDSAVEFVIGIDVDGNTKNIEVIETEETWNDAQDYGDYDGINGYFPNTPWIDNFEGISIFDLILDPVDEVGGVSTTTGSMLEAIEEVIKYHLFDFVGGAN
jgi:electron transport complex protein RnfG